MNILFNDISIRILIFMLTFAIIFPIIKKIFKDKGVSAVISMAIAGIASFYISYEQIEILFKTYGIIGIILAMLIPFMIAFFFIYYSNIANPIRKMFWIFYSILTIVILQSIISSQETLTLIIIAIVILIILIILFDKTIKDKVEGMRNLRSR